MSLQVKNSSRRIEIYRSGTDRPLITQHAEADRRPFIHPILPPDCVGELTENEPAHHPWQHGLYVGLNDVNGIGFWTEGLTGNEQDGTFHPSPLLPPRTKGNQVAWDVITEWRNPFSDVVLTETQQWHFRDLMGSTALTLDWTLEVAVDIRFGRSRYGGLFLRMPWRQATGGAILTSEGKENHLEAEGQAAKWIAVAMPLEGRNGVAGLSMFDHPTNAGHPNLWRVDGELGIAPSRQISGEWRLAKGESSKSRYRVLAFSGPIQAQAIQEAWNKFAEEY
jgi:hypothetical protein